MEKKTAAVLISACITVFLIITSANSLLSFGAEETVHTMFVNDEPWYNESQYKWINIFLVDYIPITILEKIDGIEIKFNKFLHNVMIMYGDDKYMTFDTDTSTVYTAKGDVYSASTYLLYGERYIPAELVCNYLGLRFEMTKNKTAMRISDGSEKNSFNELLLIYNPTLADIEPSEKDTSSLITTDDESVSSEDTGDEIGERTISMVFADIDSEHTPEILDILGSYGYKALFLTGENRIAGNTAIIRRIAIEGHTIGILLPDEKNNEKTYSEYYENGISANNLLYNSIKYKTRILCAENPISANARSSFESAGYMIITYNSELPRDKKISATSIYNKAQEYIRANEIVRYCFHTNANTVIALPRILII
ncbi:MAG: polysaccharide deacetylase family protein [Eubacteriales bacterium]|nr:polysaccharide deacetylase family protein [Eubacteriales bacterium]